jgi:Helix-turn-helix domain
MSLSIPPNYRLRVKQRLRVVGYARVHGIKPASRHFGLCRPTVQEWIRRWKAGGEAGLLAALSEAAQATRVACDRRVDQAGACGTALGRTANTTVARACARHPLQCPYDSTRIPRHRRAVAHETASPAAATTEAVRERRTRRIRAGGREGREAATRNDLPVHGVGRLHAVAGAAPVSAVESARQPRLLPPGASGDAIPNAEAAE